MEHLNCTEMQLGPDELNLLVWNVSNEVINGFKVNGFGERIGASEKEFQDVAKRLRLLSEAGNCVVLNLHGLGLLRNALALTLQELGVNEFQTRTGFSFEKGQTTLEEMNRFLLERIPSKQVRL